jgi:hypothetical protein
MLDQDTPDYSQLSTPDNFNPFDEQVVERAYTKPQVSYDPYSIRGIPEPSYRQPNLDELMEDDYEDEKPKKEKPKKGFGSEDPFVNKELEKYDKKDSEEASAHLVETFLDGYKVAHTIGARYFTLSEEEIVKKALKGELNPDMRIPISQTQDISVREFIAEYNNQVNEVLVVDDEFLDKVRPVMIRVFGQRGYGMTDEQYLMFAFGKDIVQKGAQLFTFKKSLQQSLKMMTQMYNEQIKSQFNTSATPPPPPTQPEPEPSNSSQSTSFQKEVNTTSEVMDAIRKNEEIQEKEEESKKIEEESRQIEEQASITMHEDMEDGISPIKKRRGRPRNKMNIATTQIEENEKPEIIDVSPKKETINIDLNKGFDIEDAKETEEK